MLALELLNTSDADEVPDCIERSSGPRETKELQKKLAERIVDYVFIEPTGVTAVSKLLGQSSLANEFCYCNGCQYAEYQTLCIP